MSPTPSPTEIDSEPSASEHRFIQHQAWLTRFEHAVMKALRRLEVPSEHWGPVINLARSLEGLSHTLSGDRLVERMASVAAQSARDGEPPAAVAEVLKLCLELIIARTEGPVTVRTA